MPTILLRNRLRHFERIRGATVEIDPPAVGPAPTSGTTNNQGRVTLNFSGLTNGGHILRVTPAHATDQAVGPGIASTANPPDRIFRALSATLDIRGGVVAIAHVRTFTHINGLNVNPTGTVQVSSNGDLIVSLQPVWMKDPSNAARGQDPSLVIIHHTGGSAIGGALSEFLGTGKSIHYMIDTDGQTIKMVQDGRRANHAGTARWAGSADVNTKSIGIEIVHKQGAYPEAQYLAMLDLLDRIKTAHRSIDARSYVGHSDVGTNSTGRLGRKSSDPGSQFKWERVEALSLGLLPFVGALPSTIYGGFFDIVPSGAFRRNDDDATRRFGGSNRPTVTGDPIQGLQQDLADIGYSVGTPDGDFGDKTHWAVQMFQEHFFAGGRGHKSPDGRVDLETAQRIRGVRMTMP